MRQPRTVARMVRATTPMALAGGMILLAATLMALAGGCSFSRSGRPARMEQEPLLRVAILTSAPSVTLSATARYSVSCRDGRGGAWTLEAGAPVQLRATASGIKLLAAGSSVNTVTSGPVEIQPAENGFATVERSRYRGAILVMPDARGSLTVINRVPMEDYLRGVVPNEIPHGDPSLIEAVEAQAVAARTYAVAYRGRYEPEGYDLLSTVFDQVYTGVEGEDEACDRAIQKTRGVIGLYHGEAIMTNYSSTCGGHTAARDEVWDKPPLPYLKGVSDEGGDGSYCRGSKHFRWEETWSGEEFWGISRRNLEKEYGVTIPEPAVLRDLKVVKRGGSGRVTGLEFQTDQGDYQASGDRIRWVTRRPAGAGPLRSILFEMSVRKSNGVVTQVTFKGGGWGHGVGMCQYGAMGRSRRGQSFREILEHYYSGIRLATLY